MASRLLITGATGMIGSLLTDVLVAQEVEFSVMLRPGHTDERLAGTPGVTVREGDSTIRRRFDARWTESTARSC